jgi:hypothetical protein
MNGLSITSILNIDNEISLPSFLWKIRCAFVHFLPSDFEGSIIVKYSNSTFPNGFSKGNYLYINLKSLIISLEDIIDALISNKNFQKNYYKLHNKEVVRLRKIIEGNFTL